jgi:YVTN family beta-propeller protein
MSSPLLARAAHPAARLCLVALILGCGDSSGPATPAGISAFAGTPQTGTVGAPVSTPPAVKIVDDGGNPVAGERVTFELFGGGGSITGAVATTDRSGVARVGSWTLGTTAGENRLRATSGTLPPVIFTATGQPGAAHDLLVTPMPLVVAGIGATRPLGVRVTDVHGNQHVAPPVQFTSLDAGVASVSAAGVVRGEAYGATTVTVTSGALSRQVGVSVIGHPILTEVARLPVSNAFGIAVSPLGAVYVTSGSHLARATLPSLSFALGPLVGQLPVAIAFDAAGARAYVANVDGRSVSVVDVATNTQTHVGALPEPVMSVAVAPDGRIYAGLGSGGVAVLDPPSGSSAFAPRATIRLDAGPALPPRGVGYVNGLAPHPTQPLLYASAPDGGAVFEIDLGAGTVRRVFDTGGKPQGIVVSADGSELYVANEGGPAEIWSLATGTRAATFPGAGGGFGIAVSPDGRQLYMTASRDGLLYVLDVAGRSVVHTLAPGGVPRRVAFSPEGGMAFIANGEGWVDVLR